MRSKRHTKVRDLLLGGLISASIAIPTLASFGYFKPIPYTGVEVLELYHSPKGIVFEANFYKNDSCKFNQMLVNGEVLGGNERFSWTDPTGPKGDRPAGWETLSIIIDDKRIADTYTIKTRHFCLDSTGRYSIKVDTTFSEWTYEEIEDGPKREKDVEQGAWLRYVPSSIVSFSEAP